MSHSPPKEEKVPSSYLRYTCLSFQMMAIMGAGAWLGIKLDAYLQMAFPLFLCMLALGSTICVIFAIIRVLT
jgi:Putative F0F1-ATPase subunit Ca2+/Mg2+ transporter